MKGKLLGYFILFTIIFSSFALAECNTKAYSCSNWNTCDSGFKDRDCSVVFHCDNNYNANPGFELATPITPINEQIACGNISNSDVESNPLVYIDSNTGKSRILINADSVVSFYHDSVYTDILPIEIEDDYALVTVNERNYFILENDEVTIDVNQDSIDDTTFRVFPTNNSLIKELEIEFIRGKKTVPAIAKELKVIQEVQEIINQTPVREEKIEANQVDKNVFIAIFVVLLLLIFNKFLRIREEELAESLLADFEKRNKVFISDDPDYFKQKDHELKVKLIKRKNYYNQVDTLLGNFRKQVAKLKTMKSNSDKIVERNIKKNEGKEFKLEVAKQLPKQKIDDLSRFIKILDDTHKKVSRVHKSKQAVGRKVREILNNELKSEYKQALKKLKGHKEIKEIKKLQKQFENKKIGHDKFKKELIAILQKK